MASVQEGLSRALTQLRDLTASQRVAILLGAILVVGSLLWLGRWAATPEMVPLLPMNLEAGELAVLTGGLDALGQSYQVSGQRVLVPPGTNRTAILAQLQQNEKLPGDTSIGFAALVKEANPWISQAENDRRWTVALQAELERILGQFAGVRQARVFLNLSARRPGFSREAPDSSASVTLIMQGGTAVSRDLALAAARLVSGAVRGLPLRNVQVVDAVGKSALDWESENGGSEFHRLRREYEQQFAEKIRSQLAFDPKVRVNVQVELDQTSRNSITSTVTDPVEISEERSSEETIRARRSGAPGVEPNVAVVAGAGGSDEKSTVETSRVQREPGRTRAEEMTPGGTIKNVFAAINISHSYLEGVYRRQTRAAEPPTLEQIQGVFDAEKQRVVSQVTMLVKPQAAEQVRVDWYYDEITPIAAGAPADPTTSESSLTLVRQYGPQAALGLLALLAIGLTLRMARKHDAGESFGLELGLPREAIDAARQAAQDLTKVAVNSAHRAGGRRAGGGGAATGGATAAESAEELAPLPAAISSAQATEGVLVAQEIDQRTVQVNKMVAQIGDMVKKDGDAMANLLERWIERTA